MNLFSAFRFKKILKPLFLLASSVIVGFCCVLFYVSKNQEILIKDQIAELNKKHKCLITAGKSYLSPFENFPKISFKINDVAIYETKSKSSTKIIDVREIYIAFNLLDLISGNLDINSLVFKNGRFNIILHEDDTSNIENALLLEKTNDNDETASDFEIHLKNISLEHIDIHKLDEATNTDVETYIYWGSSSFEKNISTTSFHFDSKLKLDIWKNGEPTYFNDKALEIHSDATINNQTGKIDINPSWITMEHGDFNIEGAIDTKNNMYLDLKLNGSKPSFNMLIAFAPHELVPILEKYKNEGNIYFNAEVKGPTLHGKMPFINVDFGADKAYLENSKNKERIEDLGFNGHFTNGDSKSLESMSFSLKNMNAKMDEGNFKCNLEVKNFEEPDVNMNLNADFNLKFLSKFLNIDSIEDLSGKVTLDLNFHDIIDFDQPEIFLNDLEQSYFSELSIKDLTIKTKLLPQKIKDLNLRVLLRDKKATLDKLNFTMGASDFSISGFISNITGIIHNENSNVIANLRIKSNLIDLEQLTKTSHEKIKNLSTNLYLHSKGKDLKTFDYLPKGQFKIENLFAKLNNYPHTLHDFNVVLNNNGTDLEINEFKGYLDDSDFHLDLKAHDYKFWFKDQFEGDVKIDLAVKSNQLRLEDLFTYEGENYIPKDYRHEKLNDLNLKFHSNLHYKNSKLVDAKINLDQLTAKMKLHPLAFKNFRGEFEFKDTYLKVSNFQGNIGKSNFLVDLNYYLGDTKAQESDNYISLKSDYIDFDELKNFNPQSNSNLKVPNKEANTTKINSHETAYNIYELPFSNLILTANINHFINNSLDFKNITARIRTTQDHYIYLDEFNVKAAGGNASIKGYFNGSNPKNIYAKTTVKTEHVDLDQLLLKFENFGQDHLVSENLHGKLTTTIDGNFKIYPDMVPNINASEIHMDVEVSEGRLENYEPMQMLSSYMGDKNLNNIRFNTLKNHIDVKDGKLTIPNMVIESTLGHMELSGSHDMDHNIAYFVKLPMKTVRKAAGYKLFGGKNFSEEQNTDDTIIEVDTTKKIRYLNLKIQGTIDDYKIKLGKKKK